MTTSYTVNPQPENREQIPEDTVKHDAAFDLTRLQFLLIGMNEKLISSLVADKVLRLVVTDISQVKSEEEPHSPSSSRPLPTHSDSRRVGASGWTDVPTVKTQREDEEESGLSGDMNL